MRFYVKILSFLGLINLLVPLTVNAQTTVTLNSGDLIKGSLSSVYYYGADGKRYVFPNEKTYFTWYNNFTGVKVIPDTQLGTISIGGNVTYRPGVKMVKITTAPNVYVVDRGGSLRHVTSEALARSLYGSTWNTQFVEDVPDAFFVNYKIGTTVQATADYNPGDVRNQTTTINQDKYLVSVPQQTVNVSIASSSVGYSPANITVVSGTKVIWTNNDSIAHTVTSNNSVFDSGTIQPGGTFSYTFNSVGTFNYHCTIHPSMTGMVTVTNS
jgi:plastocyanin